MISITCALLSEAKTLIKRYKLKQKTAITPFKVYEGDAITLIVTGVGKVNAAAGVSYLEGHRQKSSAWLNIGVAGHANHPIGNAYLAHSIYDESSGHSAYPSITFQAPCPTASMTTVAKPKLEYEGASLFEMEASGFFLASSKFSCLELIHSLKIVSDNKESPTVHVTPELIEKLVEKQIETIDRIILELKKTYRILCEDRVDLQEFNQRWNFSETQQHQLKRLVKRWHNCLPSEPFPFEKWEKDMTTKKLLHEMEKTINASPLTFISKDSPCSS